MLLHFRMHRPFIITTPPLLQMAILTDGNRERDRGVDYNVRAAVTDDGQITVNEIGISPLVNSI